MNIALTVNLKAFLNMIAISELGPALMDKSDNGYNVIVGSTAANPILFSSYADHPRKKIFIPRLNVWSTAAGRYQLLERYYDAYKKALHLHDFSPESQDLIATAQIRERHALPLIAVGNIEASIKQCSNIWASLPGDRYKQGGNTMDMLVSVYANNGGMVT